jgi:hypothetical protein
MAEDRQWLRDDPPEPRMMLDEGPVASTTKYPAWNCTKGCPFRKKCVELDDCRTAMNEVLYDERKR